MSSNEVWFRSASTKRVMMGANGTLLHVQHRCPGAQRVIEGLVEERHDPAVEALVIYDGYGDIVSFTRPVTALFQADASDLKTKTMYLIQEALMGEMEPLAVVARQGEIPFVVQEHTLTPGGYRLRRLMAAATTTELRDKMRERLLADQTMHLAVRDMALKRFKMASRQLGGVMLFAYEGDPVLLDRDEVVNIDQVARQGLIFAIERWIIAHFLQLTNHDRKYWEKYFNKIHRRDWYTTLRDDPRYEHIEWFWPDVAPTDAEIVAYARDAIADWYIAKGTEVDGLLRNRRSHGETDDEILRLNRAILARSQGDAGFALDATAEMRVNARGARLYDPEILAYGDDDLEQDEVVATFAHLAFDRGEPLSALYKVLSLVRDLNHYQVLRLLGQGVVQDKHRKYLERKMLIYDEFLLEWGQDPRTREWFFDPPSEPVQGVTPPPAEDLAMVEERRHHLSLELEAYYQRHPHMRPTEETGGKMPKTAQKKDFAAKVGRASKALARRRKN